MAFKTSSKQKLSTSSAVTSSVGTGTGGGTGPVITSRYITDSSYVNLDDTAIATAGGYIKLIGTGFASGCTVYVNGIATTTTFVSDTEVRAVIPANTNGTYSLMLFNSTGSGAIWSAGLTFSGFPSITTSLYANAGNVISTQLVGTGDGSLIYSLQGGSTLPDGVTLSSTGLISGTASAITAATVLSFTVLVDDAQNQSTQQAITLSISFGEVNFNNTVLLLNGDGVANATTNNTFIDSSATAATITRISTPTQGSVSPYSPTGWSAYFNGSTDYITLPTNTAYAFGTGDFTIEFWLYVNSASVSSTIFDSRTAGSSPCPFIATNGTSIYYLINGGTVITSAAIPSFGFTWHHIALTKASNSTKLFIDGVQSGSTYTDTNTYVSGIPTIGHNSVIGGGANWFPGNISNLRIVKGTALYTATFTPPTSPLTAITNTTLLAFQNNRFNDSSTNAAVLTLIGTPKIQAFSPFAPGVSYSPSQHGGSVYFNNSGYLQTQAFNSACTGNYTFECWVYVTTYGTTSAFFTVGSEAAGRQYFTLASSGQLWSNIYGGGNYTWGTSTSVPLNQWTHIAWVRVGTVVTGYVNGISVGTNTIAGTIGNSGGVTIGANPTGGYVWTGYLSSARLLNGTALYTGNFTPPTSPPTAIANTFLLLNFTNAGIQDATGKSNLITVGATKVSTAVAKYGTGSISFNGTTDYINPVGTNPLYAWGLSDFTIEFWVYFNAVGAQVFLFDGAVSDPSITSSIYITSASELKYFTSATDAISSGQTMAINTWYHVAVVRASLSTKLYINGTNYGAAYADNRTYIAAADRPVIGRRGSAANSYLNGYIDDLRITRMARYTANFTPPTLLSGS